ncbi:hypothetical protein H310_01060 [Aphanomyces invadans]|uniref:Sushi domain-containing protein n=1 Tax=Aphanomyces invadans TaxID=157072 RepID=A0A024US94_9STRA|nr:hypothetical protein H310_01060 [Aphanomyces invadans]ETW08493.1 hypothetical protein H310_01060 [Aphanomyces invadans]|eukprot:XP_008862298.1 hypothetical protein H310_01060 [Aphanomyces invadans]
MVALMKYISIVFLTLSAVCCVAWASSAAHQSTCPALHSIPNGRVEISGSAAGATALYSCQTHYTMTGSSSRTCKNGAWSGSEPRCRVVYSRSSDNSFKRGHTGYKIGMK